MKNIKLQLSQLKVSNKLITNINKAIRESNVDDDLTYLTINFNDSEYSAEAGGYHPVEIGLAKNVENELWRLLYITDFSYYGYPCAELVKELDFDFSEGIFSAIHCSPTSMSHNSVKEMFNIWQTNFLSYLEFGAFDQIQVSD